MKSNADAMAKLIDVNHVFCLWCTLLTSKIFSSSFPKYLKLAKIAMVQVIGSVKDECYLWHFVNLSCRIDSLPT
jgi:hypothetical protein